MFEVGIAIINHDRRSAIEYPRTLSLPEAFCSTQPSVAAAAAALPQHLMSFPQ